jgi:hypothetical protein
MGVGAGVDVRVQKRWCGWCVISMGAKEALRPSSFKSCSTIVTERSTRPFLDSTQPNNLEEQ